MFSQRDFLANALRTPQFSIGGEPAPAQQTPQQPAQPGNALSAAKDIYNLGSKASDLISDPEGMARNLLGMGGNAAIGGGLQAAAAGAPSIAGGTALNAAANPLGMATGSSTGLIGPGFAAAAGPLAFGAIGAPIAMDIVSRIFADNTYKTPLEPANFKLTDSPSHMNRLPQGADLNGLTVGDFWKLEGMTDPSQATTYGPDAQKYYGKSGMTAEEQQALVQDAQRRGIWDAFVQMRQNAIPALSGTGGGGV